MPVTVYPQPSRAGKLRASARTRTTARALLRGTSYPHSNLRILRSSYVLEDPTLCRECRAASERRPGPIVPQTSSSIFDEERPAVHATPRSRTLAEMRALDEAEAARIARGSCEHMDPAPFGSPPLPDRIATRSNGFVHTVIEAWEQDLHLTLRPDHVWLCVLTQFSFFVNGRAEALRRFFVAHEGGRRVELDMPLGDGGLDMVNVAALAQALVKLVGRRMVDESMVGWLMPSFSTTRDDDRAVAAMVFLGAIKQCFDYRVILGCGFPSVTLEGERRDWEDLRDRVGRLTQFGDDAAEWARCLGRAVDGMVESFDRPEEEETKDFWMRACHSAGPEASNSMITLSGWLTSFCWWTTEGVKQKMFGDKELDDLWHLEGRSIGWTRLKLDGVVFPVINREEIPTAITTVPITWHHRGNGARLRTTLMAGLTGMKLMDGSGSQVQPALGWWILLDNPMSHHDGSR